MLRYTMRFTIQSTIKSTIRSIIQSIIQSIKHSYLSASLILMTITCVMSACAGLGSTEDEDFPIYAVEMLELVNEFRSTGGTCGAESFPSTHALTLNAILNQSSFLHAQDMAENGYFEHESQDGRTPWDRMQAEGYRGRAYGENIAAGQMEVNDTFIQWKNSPGHCVNMLSPDFSELGVGYFQLDGSPFGSYWVQNFATPQ
jgi:uncharacterized protein YkwD